MGRGRRRRQGLTRDWKIEMMWTRRSVMTRSEVKTAPRFEFAFLDISTKGMITYSYMTTSR